MIMNSNTIVCNEDGVNDTFPVATLCRDNHIIEVAADEVEKEQDSIVIKINYFRLIGLVGFLGIFLGSLITIVFFLINNINPLI